MAERANRYDVEAMLIEDVGHRLTTEEKQVLPGATEIFEAFPEQTGSHTLGVWRRHHKKAARSQELVEFRDTGERVAEMLDDVVHRDAIERAGIEAQLFECTRIDGKGVLPLQPRDRVAVELDACNV